MNSLTTENTIATVAARFINNTNKNIFLTGKAGTGKTTFLKSISKQTYKNTAIVAPTGIAAINAGGVTIHSLFQLPFGAFVPVRNVSSHFNQYTKINTPETLFKGFQLNATKRRVLQELELLIIDEVSMLRADLLDAVDLVLKTVRKKNHIPFGGVQVLFIGDLLQLPPVIKEEEWAVLKNFYNSAYFFDALVLQQHKPLYVELDKIYRQADNEFISLLNNLRNNQVTSEDVKLLNTYYRPSYKAGINDNIIHLTTHNYKADALNKQSLQSLNEKSFFFKAIIKDDFSEHSYPVEENLELKKGAQIMFIKNDLSGAQRYFNGKIGFISKLDEEEIEVSFDDNSPSINVDSYEWQNIKYVLNEVTNEIEEKVIGTFTQYPIKLAWAITVHKSQGLTFQKAIVDIGSAFAPGQVYVALSRLTSLNGLILSSPINYDSLNVDKTISDFENTKETKDELSEILQKESYTYLQHYITQSFNFTDLCARLQLHVESYSKEEKKSVKQKYFNWANELKTEVDNSKAVADKFINQLKSIFASRQADYLEHLKTRVTAAKQHFSPLLKNLSKKCLQHIDKLKDEKRIKTYLQEIKELDSLFYKQTQLINKAEAMLDSAINKTEFTKEVINTQQQNKERIKEVEAAHVPMETVVKQRKKKSKSEVPIEKVNSKEVSFNLFKQNKTIEQIAKERQMAATTIEGHLAHYVSLGMIDWKVFVDEIKLNNIITVSKKLGTTLFNPIKQALGDEYTYSEIKFAMAYARNANTEDKETEKE